MAVTALVLILALQAVLPWRTALPEDPGLAPRRARDPAVPVIPPYPALAQRDLFSPDGAGGGGGDGAGAPLDDRQAIGVFAAGDSVAALIKSPGVSAQLVRVGQTIEGWRLAHIDREALIFQRGGAQRRMIVGAPAKTPTSPPPSATPAPLGAETPQ